MHTLRYALSCGTCAGIGSAAALMACAKVSGLPAWQPLNATSHWMWGSHAGEVPKLDAPHTGVGAVTHQASAMFWGAIFGAWLGSVPRRSGSELLRDAAVMGGIAAVTDYGLVPKRITPGWEHTLSRPGVAMGFVGMAAGLFIGGLLARPRRMP